jgi:hypothetical protein
VFRPKHTVWLATALTAMALGGAGVAVAASSGGGTSSKSSGAGTTAATTTQSSPSHNCDHDNTGS